MNCSTSSKERDKLIYMHHSYNMWKDNKDELKRSYESCPPNEWETKRDKKVSEGPLERPH